MLKLQTKIICALICLVFGLITVIRKDYLGSSILFLMLGYWIISLLSYSKVFAAFELIKTKDYHRAKELIAAVKKPTKLSKKEKGYYFMCKGIIAAAENNLDEAEDFFITALLYEKFFRNVAIVYLNLAQIALVKKNFEAARNYLEKSKASPHKRELGDYLKKTEELINLGSSPEKQLSEESSEID